MKPVFGFLLVVLVSRTPFDLNAAPPAPASHEPPKVELSPVEDMILQLTNEARAKEKLPPLKPNALLCQAARAHSANMAKQGKMEHDLDDQKPSQRVDATGYTWSAVGENIAYGWNTSVETIFQGWMDSKGHRENILNARFEEIGIGLAKNKKNEVYYTQVFGRPRKKR